MLVVYGGPGEEIRSVSVWLAVPCRADSSETEKPRQSANANTVAYTEYIRHVVALPLIFRGKALATIICIIFLIRFMPLLLAINAFSGKQIK